MSIEKLKHLTKSDVVEALMASIAAISVFVARNRAFVFAFVMTAIFYLPALKNGSANAGFLYTGDVLGWYLPALAKTHSLLHSFNLTAIDYSTFNGSSDFFLSPNFFAYHPLVVIYSIITSPESVGVKQLGRFLVLLMAFHSFMACYFSIKLFSRFFAFDFATAALIATVFAFSYHMVNALGQSPFFICASIVPWAAYAALAYAERPTPRQLIFACLPVVIGFLGGYMPLGVASLALSAILVAVKIFCVDGTETPQNKPVITLFLASLPYVFASIIVGPYLYSVYKFHQETSSAGIASLFYSAHQLAQLPQSLLQVVSTRFVVPGRVIEFSLAGGFIVIAIAAVFFLSKKTADRLTPLELKIFKVSGLIYFATVLAIFGDYSVVSDLVFYLVPQVGGMHIYERFLLPAHLIFGVILALMLKAVIQERPFVATRIALAILTVATLVVASLVAYIPAASQEIGLNNYIVFELFLGFLFFCALIIPGRIFVYIAAIVLIAIPNLDRMYDKSLRSNSFEEQRKIKPFSLDDETKQQIVSYIKRYSEKAVIKYVDITPMWSAGTVSSINADGGFETFPKVFPDYVLNELRLSSYGGFTFYLSARADYMRKMPVMGDDVAVSPDWGYLQNSGADFLVARESDLQRGGALGSLLVRAKGDDVLKLPNDVLIIPLRDKTDKSFLSNPSAFDNGYFRISPRIAGTTRDPLNIAFGKPTQQSSNAGADARLAVDGNTNGVFSLGSVSHTLRDVNAWLEVDLGASEVIGSVNIWNRTDCCGYCMRDYWLFISDKPFKAGDTASDLRARPGVWSQQNFAPNPKGTIVTGGARGRYVRIQLPGDGQALKECFLSLAEVEIFRSSGSRGPDSTAVADLKINEFTTNHANSMRMDFDTTSPSTVQYLFWDNPRLSYYLNGKRVKPINSDGLPSFEVPAGHNMIEIRYRHWPLTVFWGFYAVFALLFLWALTPVGFKIYIVNKFRKC